MKVNLQSGCEDQNRCKCDLKLKSVTASKPYVVGTSDTISLEIIIANEGPEPSFDGSITLVSDVQLPMIVDRKCENVNSNGKTFRCELSPFPKKSKRKETFNFKLENRHTTLFNLDKRSFKFNVGLMKKCKGQVQIVDWKTSIEQKIDFNSKLTTETLVKTRENKTQDWRSVGKGEPIDFNEKDVMLQHVYEITNQGPSPTTEETTLVFYVPKSDLIKDQRLSESSINCREGITNKFRTNAATSGSFIDCSNSQCMTFTCRVPENWAKDTKHNFTISMVFQNSEALKKDANSFAIFSHLSINDQMDEMVHSISQMTSVRFGAAQTVVRYLPIVLSVIFGIVIVVITFSLLHRFGCLKKLRIYNNQLEQAKEEEKRKSMAPGGAGATEAQVLVPEPAVEI